MSHHEQHNEESWLRNAKEKVEAFITQDFSEIPEGQSECLQLDEPCAVVVNPDPFVKGQFCVIAVDLITGKNIAGGVFPLDDLTDKLRMLFQKLLNGVVAWVRERTEKEMRDFAYFTPQLG